MSEDVPVTGALLVVDDNEMNRDMLSRRLTRRGHEVQVASDGRVALEMVRQRPFDLVLLDVMMPGINGFQVLEALRERFASTELPVVMATAKDGSSDVVQALKAGANDYVTKPLDFPVVLARVQTQLALKRSVDRIRQLEAHLTRRNADLEAANGRMTRDLEAAAEVQRSGLPASAPPVDGFSFAWTYRPCDELGGDSLNVLRLDDRYLLFYVLDVSGHGVPAALLSVSLNRELRPRMDDSSLVTRWEGKPPARVATSPAAVVGRLNRLYPMAQLSGRFFTMLYGLVDTEARQFRFASAGHPPFVRVDRGGAVCAQRLQPDFPVGIVEGAEFAEHAIDLDAGDRVYLFSDGLIEQMNEDREMFGRVRLEEGIQAVRGSPLKQSVDDLLSRVVAWAGSSPVGDDLTLAAFEVEGDG